MKKLMIIISVMFILTFYLPRASHAECTDTIYRDVDTTSTGSVDNTITVAARASGFSSNSNSRIVSSLPFTSIAASDIRVNVPLNISGGGIRSSGFGFYFFGTVSARLNVTNTINGRNICNKDQEIEHLGAPFGDDRTINFDSSYNTVLSCSGESSGISGGNIIAMVTLTTDAGAYGFGEAAAGITTAVGPFQLERCCVDALDAPDGMVPLFSWYSPSRRDNFITSQAVWAGCRGSKRSPDYEFVRQEGFVFDPAGRQPGGTIPLNRWYSPSQQDNWTTTSHSDQTREVGQVLRSTDYRFSRLEGYVYSEEAEGTITLNRWYNPNQRDNWTTTQHSDQSNRTLSVTDYRFSQAEGFVIAP